jgi:hypothetical protein
VSEARQRWGCGKGGVRWLVQEIEPTSGGDEKF